MDIRFAERVDKRMDNKKPLSTPLPTLAHRLRLPGLPSAWRYCRGFALPYPFGPEFDFLLYPLNPYWLVTGCAR